MVNPAERLVQGFGGRSGAAKRFDVSSEAIRLWLVKGIPTDRALDVEEATRDTEFAIAATDVLEYAKAQREAA